MLIYSLTATISSRWFVTSARKRTMPISGRERDNAQLRAANDKLRKSLADKEELVRQLRALSVDGG